MQASGCMPVRKVAAGIRIRVTASLPVFVIVMAIGWQFKYQLISTSFTANIGEDYI